MSETAEQMIERIRNRMETDPYPVVLTKYQWAQIIGLAREGKVDDKDIRLESLRALEDCLGIDSQ